MGKKSGKSRSEAKSKDLAKRTPRKAKAVATPVQPKVKANKKTTPVASFNLKGSTPEAAPSKSPNKNTAVASPKAASVASPKKSPKKISPKRAAPTKVVAPKVAVDAAPAAKAPSRFSTIYSSFTALWGKKKA